MERLCAGEEIAPVCNEEEKKQRANANASLSLLLGGMMVLMAGSHCDAPMWLVSELFAVHCLLLYVWAYHLTQNLTADAVVEAPVFSFPFVFGAGYLTALLAVAVGPVAGVLVMVADLACTSAFFVFCLAKYVHFSKPPVERNNKRVQDKITSTITSFQNC